VLVDSRRAIELVWHEWARRHGLDAAALLRVAHGRRTSETLREVAPQLDPAVEAAALDALEAVEERGVVEAPGARELIAALSREQWAVVTSGSPAVAALRLRVGRIPEPPLLITGADVRRGKPSPEGYLRAAAALGQTPAACVVFEDTPAGIAAGKAAGTRVLAVRGTYPDERLAAADGIVNSLARVRCTASAGHGLLIAWEPG
jgi:mannitol-1-/sugar-/sorbitol-6-phosphatase